MTPKDALEFIASELNCTVDIIRSKSKANGYPRVRNIATYVIKEWLDLTLVETGKIMHRDHSSIITSLTKVNNLTYPGIEEEAEHIISMLECMKLGRTWLCYPHATLNGLYTMPKVF